MSHSERPLLDLGKRSGMY